MEDPCEEGGAEGDLGGEEEVGVVYELRFGFVAKVIENGVHGVLVAQELHRRTFTVEELKGFFAEVSDAVGFRALYGRYVQKFRGLVDAVNPEGGNFLVLIGPSNHVIAVAVPVQRIGAEDIGFAVVLQALALGCSVGEVEKPDLFLFVDRPVDDVDVLVYMLILRLDPICNGDVSLQLVGALDIGQRCQLIGQDLAFAFRDKLGRSYSVGQELQLRLLEGPGGHVIAILPGMDGPHVVAGRYQRFHVSLHSNPIRRDAPALL